jgi:hypothetical protein
VFDWSFGFFKSKPSDIDHIRGGVASFYAENSNKGLACISFRGTTSLKFETVRLNGSISLGPRYTPTDERYLLSLQDEVFDLSSSSAGVWITSETTIFPVIVDRGELHFIRVQNLLIDNNPDETILSGTFEFQGVMNGNPLNVTRGRFDVGLEVGSIQGY